MTLPIPPGRNGLPLLGETIQFARDPHFLQKRQAVYGNIFKSHIFGQPTIFICGSESLQIFFSKEAKHLKVNFPPPLRILLGEDSLSLQSGANHARYRRLLAQSFHPRKLADYVLRIQQITIKCLEQWKSQQPCYLYPSLRSWALQTTCSLLIGLNSQESQALFELFEDWSGGLFSFSPPLPGTKFSRALKARQKLLQYFDQLIDQRLKTKALEPDILSTLLQATDGDGSQLSRETIKTQILTLLFAGHETITSALTSFSLLMAQHPSVAQALRTEQLTVLGATPQLTLDSLAQLPLLDAVLKEVLRLLPPVAGGFRQVVQAVEIGGYLFPHGWNVIFQIDRIHVDPSLYADPETFDPTRFTTGTTVKPFDYIPYGCGIHECLGKELAQIELKIFVSLLIQRFTWELVPGQDLTLERLPTPHPKSGLAVMLTKR